MLCLVQPPTRHSERRGPLLLRAAPARRISLHDSDKRYHRQEKHAVRLQMEYDKDKVDQMVLSLLYLTMFEDNVGQRSWKSHD